MTITGSTNATTARTSASQSRRKSRKWSKPKDKPKHPLSAYNLFFQSERARVRGEARKCMPGRADMIVLPLSTKSDRTENALTSLKGASSNATDSSKANGFVDLVRGVAARWKTIDETSKAYFEEQARLDQRRYQRELAEWKALQHTAQPLPSSASTQEEVPPSVATCDPGSSARPSLIAPPIDAATLASKLARPSPMDILATEAVRELYNHNGRSLGDGNPPGFLRGVGTEFKTANQLVVSVTGDGKIDVASIHQLRKATLTEVVAAKDAPLLPPRTVLAKAASMRKSHAPKSPPFRTSPCPAGRLEGMTGIISSYSPDTRHDKFKDAAIPLHEDEVRTDVHNRTDVGVICCDAASRDAMDLDEVTVVATNVHTHKPHPQSHASTRPENEGKCGKSSSLPPGGVASSKTMNWASMAEQAQLEQRRYRKALLERRQKRKQKRQPSQPQSIPTGASSPNKERPTAKTSPFNATRDAIENSKDCDVCINDNPAIPGGSLEQLANSQALGVFRGLNGGANDVNVGMTTTTTPSRNDTLMAEMISFSTAAADWLSTPANIVEFLRATRTAADDAPNRAFRPRFNDEEDDMRSSQLYQHNQHHHHLSRQCKRPRR